MSGEHGSSPDQSLAERASIYAFAPYNSNLANLRDRYSDGEELRWSLNNEEFKITIWPIFDFDQDKHETVDPKGYLTGSHGYVSKKKGVVGSSIMGLATLTDNEKEAVIYAITNYLAPHSK